MKEQKPRDGRKRLGAWGEHVAATHLEANGYHILDRNWRCRQGEIDLVAIVGATVVFVEVKTRRGRPYGAPEEALTFHKQQKLSSVAQAYLWMHQLEEVDWRIDLIAVELDAAGKLLRCEHVENAVMGW